MLCCALRFCRVACCCCCWPACARALVPVRPSTLYHTQVATQVGLIALLWGTMCGGLALIHDVSLILLDKLAAAAAHQQPGAWSLLPCWLMSGRACMTAVTVLVLFPLCLQRHMREVREDGALSVWGVKVLQVVVAASQTHARRSPSADVRAALTIRCMPACPSNTRMQLESAATAGVVLVLALIGLLAAEALRTGFPAIRDGSLPLWSLKVDGHLPEAFSVVGYAFYMQARSAPGLHIRMCMATF